MHHAIGDHALIAGAGTAALLDPAGGIAWLCWPRIDSDPLLLPILDGERGGEFSLRPADPEAAAVRREYLDGTLVVRTTWHCGRGTLHVDELLVPDGEPRLLRVLSAEGAEVPVTARFRPAFGAGTASASIAPGTPRLLASAPGIRLAVTAPAAWERTGSAEAVAGFAVRPGVPAAVVLDSGDGPPADAPAEVASTLAAWRSLSRRIVTGGLEGGLGARVLGMDAATSLLRLCGLVLVGLMRRGGGIVAAPTTSLPQWPGTSRTWDYRFAWLRDTALAGLALVRLGLVEEAAALGDFCGAACIGREPPAVLRVDGSMAPEERVLEHLSGHLGSRPVRLGNAASRQTQLDLPGEILDLAHVLEQASALPDSLWWAAPHLADLAARRWKQPDHGIWEARGAPRRYTHSQVMAWVALRRAEGLRRRGAVEAGTLPWEDTAALVHASVMRGRGPLRLAPGGGADASLALVPLVGFLPPGNARTRATLQLISDRLTRGGLVDRHEGVLDGNPEPCAPFVFATFWLAAAREVAGLDGGAHFAAACASRGPLGLFGEVADPDGGGPLGNYPQVQSHASYVLAATTRPAEAGPRLLPPLA